MHTLFVLLTSLLFTNGWCAADPLADPVSNLTQYIHHLEEKVSLLESQSKTTDQKYAAVLSSVLSKLTSQTDELLKVQAQQNSTLAQLNKVTKILDQVKADGNYSTTQCAEGNQEGNVSEVCSTCPAKFDMSQNMTDNNFRKTDVAFEAKLSKNDDVHGNTLLKFSLVTSHVGGGYDSKKGIFTAPVSGIYQIWFNIAYTPNRLTSHTKVKILVNNIGVATAVPPVPHGDSTTSNPAVKIDGIHLVTVRKGDVVTFSLSDTGTIRVPSNYGGVLIHYMPD